MNARGRRKITPKRCALGIFGLKSLATAAGLIALACGKERPRFELMVVSPIDQTRISAGIFTDTSERCEELGRKYLSAYCNSRGAHENPMMAITCDVPTQKIVEHAWECRPY